MAISEAWLKAQLGKDREKIEEFADRDAMSVRITPKGKIVFQWLCCTNLSVKGFSAI